METLWLILWVACAGLSAFIASSKGRSVSAWAIIGLLTGIVGVIIIACLSPIKEPAEAGS